MVDSSRFAARTALTIALFAAFLTVCAIPGVLAGTISVKVGNAHKQSVDLYSKQFGVSKATAERWIRQQEREKGVRIIDEFNLPEGSLIDFYKVRNDSNPDKRVKYEGRGRLVDGVSYLGLHYKEILFGLLNTKQRDDAIKLLRQARDHGFMIVPAAFETGNGPVDTAAAEQITAVVIGTEFPYWNDIAPSSDGDTVQTDMNDENHYLALPDDLNTNNAAFFPMRGNNAAWEQQDVASAVAGMTFHQDWYADSPGGPITNGIPIGLRNPAWSHTGSTSGAPHPYYGGNVSGAIDGSTEIDFQNFWSKLLFDKAPGAQSLYQYYYQNSHGNISFEGDASHVVGWLHSHHVTDRLPYPGASYFQANDGCTQPGTPVYRPFSPTANGIVRASSNSTHVSVLLNREAGNAPTLTYLAYWQQDTNGNTAGDQSGWISTTGQDPSGNPCITMVFNAEGSGAWIMDPYDRRHWTIMINTWQYMDYSLATPAWRNYTPWDNQPWVIRVSYQTANLVGGFPVPQTITASWDGSISGYMPQLRGCGALPEGDTGAGNGGTIFRTEDVYDGNVPGDPSTTVLPMGSRVGARLKSFCYYVFNHAYVNGTDPYQLAHLRNANGRIDDVGGTTESADDRRDRPFPYNHDSEDHGRPNAGNVLFAPAGQGGHSAGAMRSDINQVLADSGIDISSYDKKIYLFPANMQNENDSGPIIPHAGGDMATVPTNCGLTLLAHEIGHTFGMADLYDNDFYRNNVETPPQPPYYESATVGPYSLMARGVRVDPWHKLQKGWAQGLAVTADLPTAQVPMVEGTLREPVILKLPAHPLAIYAMKNSTPPAGFTVGPDGLSWSALANPDMWKEYFLIENRNVNGALYFGDPSRRGLYIWHIDERNIGGFQRAEETLTVALEQADGLNELENNRDGNFGNMDTDPFGLNNFKRFTERSKPSSWSHGRPNSNTLNETIVPETPTDSFVRITDISGPGSTMTAGIFVEPREVHTEGSVDMISTITEELAGFKLIKQGAKNIPFLKVTLHNDSQFPNISTGPVTINNFKVLESGTSINDGNIASVKLFEDDGNGTLDVLTDTLLATTSVVSDVATFSNLGYEVPWALNTDTVKTLFVAYDISETADTNPQITLGAELSDYTFITPDQPGAVQVKKRFNGDGYNFINPATNKPEYRFPITSTQAIIVENADTLFVRSATLAPSSVLQGTLKVPLMRLRLSVDHDAVTINKIQVDEVNTALGGTDISTIMAYQDVNEDGAIDSGDLLLGEAALQKTGTREVANISGVGTTPLAFTVVADTNEYIILAANVQDEATVGNFFQVQLKDTTSIGLVQNPSDTDATRLDIVSSNGFTHQQETATEILLRNEAPTPPPATDGDPRWRPTGGEVVGQTPDCQFPAGDDVDPEDDSSTLTYIAEFSQDNFTTIKTFNVTPNPLDDPGTVKFSILPADALKGGNWKWRVRAVDSHGIESANSAAHTFVVDTPPYAAIAPFAPSGVVVNTLQPVFSWALASPPDEDPGDTASTIYTFIEIDNDSDFSSPLNPFNPMLPLDATNQGLSAQGATTHTPNFGLVKSTTYYWRTRTINDSGILSEDWGPTQTFDVATNLMPAPPTTGFAPTGNLDNRRPTFTWGAAVDPDTLPAGLRYEVQLDVNNDWSDGQNIITDPSPAVTAFGVTSLTLVTPKLNNNTTYYWRVRTQDDTGIYSNWSVTQSFTVQLTDAPPVISNLIPASGAIDVAIDTTISFKLTDPGSGLDLSTLKIYVDDVLVPAGQIATTGTIADTDVTITLAAPLDYLTVYKVRVYVEDLNANIIVDENGLETDGYEWSFTTMPIPTYVISGVVKNAAGDPLSGVTISYYSDATFLGTVTTDDTGAYAIPAQVIGSYKIVPSLTEYNFAPIQTMVTLTDADVADINFTGSVKTYSISGLITEDGVAKQGVTVTAGGKATLTDVDGKFVITGLPNGTYTVTPTLTFFDFTPVTKSVTIAGAAVTDVTFTAKSMTFKVSGTVRDYDGTKIVGATVRAGAITATTDATGKYELIGIKAGDVIITATKAGMTLFPESQTVTVDGDKTGIDFVAYNAFTKVFSTGINFMGVPCYPVDDDPSSVFDITGGDKIARWNPNGTPPAYLVLPGAASTDLGLLDVKPGRGYFVRLANNNFSVAGRPVTTARAFTLTLGPAWNMVANMFTNNVPFANFTPGLTDTVRPYGYIYKTTTPRGYLLVSATEGVNVARTYVMPWEGMWMRCTTSSATVNVAPPVGTSAVEDSPRSVDLGEDGWAIPIVARADDSEDSTTVIGLAPALTSAIRLENPPMAPRTVDVFVADADGAYLAQDIRNGSVTTQSWNFDVVTDMPDTRVEVALPDLTAIPSDLAVYLTDLSSGKRIYARTMGNYVFTSGATGARRQFKLEVAPRREAALAVTSAAVAPSGAGMVVTYNVSRDCNISVKITNIAGRVIRVLSDGAAVTAGINSTAWDLKSAAGTAVPAGRYLISVEAVSEDGQRVNTITSAMVRR